ncbi:MAG: hypothetical protein F9B45_33260 [Phycisphaera sp. RhM]|nr:hypothetical protein [Phycisphaera sp. RhM]
MERGVVQKRWVGQKMGWSKDGLVKRWVGQKMGWSKEGLVKRGDVVIGDQWRALAAPFNTMNQADVKALLWSFIF